jgi:hypothetical protein
MAIWDKGSQQNQSIPVRAGSVEIFYAGNPAQVTHLHGEIDRWQGAIHGNPSPAQRDSLELALYAIRRWQEAHKLDRTAKSVKLLKDMIKDNPRGEVRVLGVARATWLRAHRTVGVCSFRRTWCNNIALDVIAAHPVLDERENSPIAGLGTGLIHHVCLVAESIEAYAIWGECTQNSRDFYAAFGDRPPVAQDLIVLSAEDYKPLKIKIETKWQDRKKPKDNL